MKTFRMLGALALCAVTVPFLTACGDDNDEPDNGGVNIIQGDHLTSVGNYGISYDSKGRVSSVRSNGDVLYIDYDHNTITVSDNDDYDDEGELNVKFNGKGFITELSSSWDYQDRDDGEFYRTRGSGKIEYRYDGDGNLISVNCKSDETEEYNNRTEKYSENYTIDLTWSNGCMMKSVENGEENEDGRVHTWTETYDVQYGNQANAYLQMPLCLSEIFGLDDELDVLGVIGLFGNGPAFLPNKLTETETYDRPESWNISFTLNDNGSIASERIGSTTYRYTYGTISTRSGFGADKQGKKFNVRDVFVHRK